jgi:hypothetical protein
MMHPKAHMSTAVVNSAFCWSNSGARYRSLPLPLEWDRETRSQNRPGSTENRRRNTELRSSRVLQSDTVVGFHGKFRRAIACIHRAGFVMKRFRFGCISYIIVKLHTHRAKVKITLLNFVKFRALLH